jgi:hypothetical protein
LKTIDADTSGPYNKLSKVLYNMVQVEGGEIDWEFEWMSNGFPRGIIDTKFANALEKVSPSTPR